MDMELGLGMSFFMIKAGGIVLQFLLRPPSPQSAPLLFPFTTLMAQVLCPGCNKALSLNGLAGHLRKTRDVCCRTVRGTLQPPGPIHGAASSLVSIPEPSYFFSPDESLELGANQWRHCEMDFSRHTQEGNFTVTCISGLRSLLIICIFQDWQILLFLVKDVMQCPTQWMLRRPRSNTMRWRPSQVMHFKAL